MTEFRRRFDPTEVAGVTDDGTSELLGTARDLETYAEIGWSGPSATFEDRVMAAIAAEPAPRLIAGMGPIGMLRDAWRLATSGGRPFAVRAQALALVLVAAVAVGAMGSLGVVAASRLLAPEVAPTPTIEPSPGPSLGPTPAPTTQPTPSPSPSASPERTAPQTPRPSTTEQPTGTDDHSGSGSSDGDDGGSLGSDRSGSDDGESGESGGDGQSGSGQTLETNDG